MEENKNYNRNKGKYSLLLPIVVFALFCAVFTIITVIQWDELDSDSRIMPIVCIVFSGSLFCLCVAGFIDHLIKCNKEEKIIDNGYRTKGRIKDIKFSESTTVKSGRTHMAVNTLYFVCVAYTDENGIEREYKLSTKLNRFEVSYLLYLKEFDIACDDGRCIILENLEKAYEADDSLIDKFLNAPKIDEEGNEIKVFNPEKLPHAFNRGLNVFSVILILIIYFPTFAITFGILYTAMPPVGIFIGIVFSAYLVYMIWYLIKIIKINIAYKKGREDYALDFVVYPYRRYKSDMYVRIKFKYIDENGVQRTTKYIVQDAEYEILKTLVRLPIKVYKKSASVDYKRLSNF